MSGWDWSKGYVLKMMGLEPCEYVDTMLSLAMKRPMFDIWKFDDYLHGRFGNYEEQGKSMRDILREHYPRYAEKIEELFTGE